MDSQRKIIVGVDGSPQSEAALRWAVAEAAPGGDEVRAVLVRAREELLPGTSYAIQPHGRRHIGEPADYAGRLHETVRKIVDQLETPPPVTEIVVEGDPASELIKESTYADLLAVGSHGASTISELLLGSVTTQCARHAPCPVVVITADSAQRLR